MVQQAIVIRAYARPYADPITVCAGDQVVPDFDRKTDIPGWVWCVAKNGRGGWTPRAWLERKGDRWRIDRNFNAIELTVAPGEVLEVEFAESGFYWVVKADGETGWVPCDHVSVAV